MEIDASIDSYLQSCRQRLAFQLALRQVPWAAGVISFALLVICLVYQLALYWSFAGVAAGFLISAVGGMAKSRALLARESVRLELLAKLDRATSASDALLTYYSMPHSRAWIAPFVERLDLSAKHQSLASRRALPLRAANGFPALVVLLCLIASVALMPSASLTKDGERVASGGSKPISQNANAPDDYERNQAGEPTRKSAEATPFDESGESSESESDKENAEEKPGPDSTLEVNGEEQKFPQSPTEEPQPVGASGSDEVADQGKQGKQEEPASLPQGEDETLSQDPSQAFPTGNASADADQPDSKFEEKSKDLPIKVIPQAGDMKTVLAHRKTFDPRSKEPADSKSTSEAGLVEAANPAPREAGDSTNVSSSERKWIEQWKKQWRKIRSSLVR